MTHPRDRVDRVAAPVPPATAAPSRAGSAPAGAAPARSSADLPLVRARWVLMGLFALNGLTFSSWLARIPAVRDALELSTGQLGSVLLAGSLGALATATVAGVLVTRRGGRLALLISTVGFALAYVLIGAGPTLGSVPLLAVGIFLTGVSFAVGNVPLNVESASVERRMGRTVLPQFHAAFSIGAVLGSGIGAVAAHLDVPLLSQFLVTAVLGTVWRLLSIPHVVVASRPVRERVLTNVPAVPGAPAPRAPRRRGLGTALDAWREPRTVLIGVVIMAAALSEGSANDWLALAVVDGFDQPEAVGAAVFGSFVAAMTVVRLLGTRLIDRYGRVAVLRASGVVSLVGLLVFGFAPTLPLAGAGVVAWGLGAALAVPLGIAAASDDPMLAAGRVAVVSAFSSVASLAAPPLLGLAAESLGARHALVLIAAAMVVSVSLSSRVARVEPAEAGTPAPAAPTAAGPRSAPTPATPTAASDDPALAALVSRVVGPVGEDGRASAHELEPVCAAQAAR
ncbi:MFS transporter [Cellulomonas cellasea]|uniref:MFS family permease n=1 Tax=Cellulomonas cellasea TaxID=43670 RepID=A0A7W4UEC9_9CELL|nr:MFS transporter [Cellulomonas cellasea]MBB2922502.1 MFS family permease [Cellulomonas cellasea]